MRGHTVVGGNLGGCFCAMLIVAVVFLFSRSLSLWVLRRS